MPIRGPSDAQTEKTSAIVFIVFGAILLLTGNFTAAVFCFALAGYAARLWKVKNELRRTRENPAGEISVQEEDLATNALADLLRATFDLRFVRKSLALLSFCLSIVYICWAYLNTVQHSVAPKNTGHPFYGALSLIDACLYWCLGFRIPTYFRRWIASSALGISVWIFILALQLPSPDFPDPPEIVHISALILLPIVGAFITLALISFVDDEDGETRK